MTQERLIENLINEGYLKTPTIIEAFKVIDRNDFVPKDKKDLAYINQPLPIGENQTISQPLTVAFMLELLEPKTGEKILDIGTGSGWQAALLAHIVNQNDKSGSGKVITIERINALHEQAKENINKYKYIDEKIIHPVLSDATKGYKQEAPYDKIIAAATGEEVPESWKKQLKIGGKIVAPIDSSIYLYIKEGENDFKKKQFFGFSFVPLLKGIDQKT